jgi:hypothetical protein
MISNTELSTLAVAKQLLIYGLSKAGTPKKKGVTGKRKCLTIKFCHAPSCPQSERLPTSPINVMDAFLLRLLHQNMQYVLLFLYLLQVAFVYRIFPDERDQASITSDAYNNYNRTGIFSAGVFTHERIPSPMPSPLPPPPASPLSPNYSADLLSENFSESSKIATPAKLSASIQVARWSSLLSGRAVSPVGAVSPSSIVAATPCKKRLTTSGAGSSHVNTPTSLSHLSSNSPLRFGDIHQRNLLDLMQHGAYVSSTVADETSFHSMVPPSSLCDLPDTAPHPVHHTSIHVVSAEGGDDCPSLETRLTQ